MTALLALIALLAPGATTAPSPPTAAMVAGRVQKFYADAKHFTAQFSQVVSNPTFGTHSTSGGAVALEKPDKMHWTYVKRGRPDRELIHDGTTLWIVDHGNKQIAKATLAASSLPIATAFLDGTAHLGSEITTALDTTGTYGKATRGAIVLELAPIKPSVQWKQLFLVVDPSDFHVTESIVVAPDGDRNDVSFTAVAHPAQLPATEFSFEPKAFPIYKLVELPATPTGGAASQAPLLGGAGLGAPIRDLRVGDGAGKSAPGTGAPGTGLPGGGPSVRSPADVETGDPGTIQVTLARRQALDETTLTEQLVARRIETSYLPGVRSCYLAALRSNHGAAGSVIAGITISTTGRTSAVNIKAFDDEVASCVKAHAATWRFPVPKDKAANPTTADFKLIFRMATRS